MIVLPIVIFQVLILWWISHRAQATNRDALWHWLFDAYDGEDRLSGRCAAALLLTRSDRGAPAPSG